jgi:hypothetical protein
VFCDKNFAEYSKFLFRSSIFTDFEDYLVCPDGRLGAARPPSLGVMTFQEADFKGQGVMNFSALLTYPWAVDWAIHDYTPSVS